MKGIEINIHWLKREIRKKQIQICIGITIKWVERRKTNREREEKTTE
jgi:hypothetical protein